MQERATNAQQQHELQNALQEARILDASRANLQNGKNRGEEELMQQVALYEQQRRAVREGLSAEIRKMSE